MCVYVCGYVGTCMPVSPWVLESVAVQAGKQVSRRWVYLALACERVSSHGAFAAVFYDVVGTIAAANVTAAQHGLR